MSNKLPTQELMRIIYDQMKEFQVLSSLEENEYLSKNWLIELLLDHQVSSNVAQEFAELIFDENLEDRENVSKNIFLEKYSNLLSLIAREDESEEIKDEINSQDEANNSLHFEESNDNSSIVQPSNSINMRISSKYNLDSVTSDTKLRGKFQDVFYELMKPFDKSTGSNHIRPTNKFHSYKRKEDHFDKILKSVNSGIHTSIRSVNGRLHKQSMENLSKSRTTISKMNKLHEMLAKFNKPDTIILTTDEGNLEKEEKNIIIDEIPTQDVNEFKDDINDISIN